jgi:hypothetical protein
VKEFPVPDVVKSMAWCGDNLCLGIRREYVIMNTLTGAFFEVFPCGRIAPPLVVSLPSGDLVLGKVLPFQIHFYSSALSKYSPVKFTFILLLSQSFPI